MEDQTETTEAQAVAAISLNDLQIMVNIIDLCTKRGAFQGDELLPVGQIREKLVTFVKANAPAQAEAADEAAE